MKKLNQKGFGVLEGMLIFVVIAIVAGVGIYIWNNKDTGDTTNNSSEDTSKSEKSQAPKKLKAGYTLYKDQNLSIQYPEEWTQYKEKDQPEWVFFKSPDYLPANGLGPSVKRGQWLEVRVAKSEDNESHESDLKNLALAEKAHGGSYEVIEIDGQKAVLSDIKSHGTHWDATTYSNGKTYYFRYNVVDEDKPGVKDFFKSLLDSVDL